MKNCEDTGNEHEPHKASVKLMTFVRENQIIPWQGVYFFTNTVLQNHRNIYTVVLKHDKHHW